MTAIARRRVEAGPGVSGARRAQAAAAPIPPEAQGMAVTELCVLVFFLLFWANVLVVASQRYGVPAAISSGAVLLLAIPLVGRSVLASGPVVVTPTLVPIVLYLAAMCLSSAAAVHADATVPQLTNFVLEGVVLYVLVSNAAADVDRWRRILWVIVLAAVAMSALAVFQELTRAYDNDFGGFAQVSAGGFDVAEDGSIVKELRPRLAGPIGEQNRFAQVLLAAAPLAYFGAAAAPRRSHRTMGYAAAGLIVSGVLVTFSRGASIAMGGLVLLALVHRFVRLRHVVLIGAMLTAAVMVVAPDYVVRLTSLTSVVHIGDPTTKEVDGAIRGRTVELLAAWNTFVAHPLVGVGPGRFFREYSQIEANKLSGAKHLDTERRAHNLYAELLADLGIAGFAAFTATNGVTIALLVRARRRWRGVDLQREHLAAGVLFALYSYLLTAFFLQLSYQRYYWALLAMCNGVAFALLPRHAFRPTSGVAASRRR